MIKNTIINSLREQMKDINNSACVEVDGVNVNVCVTKMKKMCVVKVRKKYQYEINKKCISNILNILNTSQDMYEYDYYIETNEIELKATMWVDTKNGQPSQSSLAELINEMVSHIKSIELMLNNSEGEF